MIARIPPRAVLLCGVLSVLLAASCQDLSQTRRSGEIVLEARIVRVILDDLDRVLVLARGNDNTAVAFVKDFYQDSTLRARRRSMMKDYAQSLEPFMNRKVLVRYFVNGIGDNTIISIIPARKKS
jgi:hypothetical protein